MLYILLKQILEVALSNLTFVSDLSETRHRSAGRASQFQR